MVPSLATESSALQANPDQFGSSVWTDTNTTTTRQWQSADAWLLNQTKQQQQQQQQMASNLRQFSSRDDDLMFEDSMDVQTSHYNTTDQVGSASVVSVVSAATNPSAHSSTHPLTHPPTHSPTPTDHHQPRAPLNGHFAGSQRSSAPQSYLLMDSWAKSNVAPMESNHLTAELATDLSPRGNSVVKHHYRDTLPKRSDRKRLQGALNDLTTDHQLFAITNHTDSVQQSSMTGDHILRPFFRKERKSRDFHHHHKPTLLAKGNGSRSGGFEQAWSLPVVELKRLNDHTKLKSTTVDMFKKRLPLMGNEEGFVLTKPNSSRQPKSDQRTIDKRMDTSYPSEAPTSHIKHDFKRRFGDLFKEPNSNQMPTQTVGKPGTNLGYVMDDIAVNDLDLDDIGPARVSGGQRNNPKNFKPRQPVSQNNQPTQSGLFDSVPPSSTTGPGQPISQIMPLFFDKFLSEFGNSNTPLSPEGFALPPTKDKFDSFEPSQQPPTSSSHLLPPINQIDPDLADLDAPNLMERRLVNGNLAMNKPEIGPPLFSNEIGSANEFDNEFGHWPKIFRFTDGRINLHDFEREKKRSRIKFSSKASKSQALYNIKRDSFLILHGGTFSQ